MTKILAWESGELKEFEKLEVHRKGLRHPAISVFIFSRNKLLLQRRALEKYHTPGLWTNTCCTHPFPGEKPKSCSKRRLKEEMGITGVSLNFSTSIEYKANVGNNLIENEVVDIFFGFIEKISTFRFTPHPEEVMDTKWISIEKLKKAIESSPEKFTPWLRIYIKDYSILKKDILNS